jgi:hypothetical protein
MYMIIHPCPYSPSSPLENVHYMPSICVEAGIGIYYHSVSIHCCLSGAKGLEMSGISCLSLGMSSAMLAKDVVHTGIVGRF